MPDRGLVGRLAASPRHIVAALALLAVIAVLLVWTDAVSGGDEDGPTYTVVQMNLCLSGRASCFPSVQYPRGVRDAAAKVLELDADAVTLDEVCSEDVDDIARRTGYDARFAAVTHSEFPVVCGEPDGRGDYGIAVLTKAPITQSLGRRYDHQDGIEERRWLCASTSTATVCSTHLEIRGFDQLDDVNDAQCDEYADIVADLVRTRPHLPLVAGGDMNRPDPCAATGMWAETDEDADQIAGKQHIYGTEQLRDPSAEVVPMEYTDHDALVVTSRLGS